MRPGQNKRMRGRPSNNRRSPNPLTRSYESNGPDVKIRGNAHHVAEKYLQLARDAHTSGDPVAAENYLQHAEHYFRLIASAQAAQALAAQGRAPGEGEDAEDDDDGGVLSDRFASPPERAPAPYAPAQQPFQQPQPNPGVNAPQYGLGERQPYEPDRQNSQDRNNFQPRHNRQPDRGPRQDRPFHERQEGQRDNRGPNDGRPREFRPYRDQNSQRESNFRETAPAIDAGAPTALPSFITAAPRVNVGAESAEPLPLSVETGPVMNEAPEALAAQGESSAEGRFPGRGRRRRLRSPYGFHPGGNGEDDASAPVDPDKAPGE